MSLCVAAAFWLERMSLSTLRPPKDPRNISICTQGRVRAMTKGLSLVSTGLGQWWWQWWQRLVEYELVLALSLINRLASEIIIGILWGSAGVRAIWGPRLESIDSKPWGDGGYTMGAVKAKALGNKIPRVVRMAKEIGKDCLKILPESDTTDLRSTLLSYVFTWKAKYNCT